MTSWWEQCEADMRSLLEKTGYFSSLKPVACACGECGDRPADAAELDTYDYENGDHPNWYDCEFCGRVVPYCFGQDDDLFEFCDECAMAWFELMEMSGELSKRANKLRGPEAFQMREEAIEP